MENIYLNINDADAFTSAAKLRKRVKKPVDKWLSGQLAYSLNKPMRKRFPTRAYKTSGINELWQMDLMEMIPYAQVNKGYRYILTCIDVFSRFAYAQPVKTKSGEDVRNAIAKMFTKGKPSDIQTDLGKEFYNKHVKLLFDKYNINHYSVHSQFKAALVERFNRTLRGRLAKYFVYIGKKVWYNVLQKLVDAYNHSKHRSIGMKPVEVTREVAYKIWEINCVGLYGVLIGESEGCWSGAISLSI